MGAKTSLQDRYLNELRREKTNVSVYLTNGIKLQGHIESFDQFVIVLKNGSVNQMVYKHATSTVVPSKAVKMYQDMDKDQQDKERDQRSYDQSEG